MCSIRETNQAGWGGGYDCACERLSEHLSKSSPVLQYELYSPISQERFVLGYNSLCVLLRSSETHAYKWLFLYLL